jgi:hypothetical protein
MRKRNGRQEREELVVREDPVIAAEKTQNFFLYFGLSNKRIRWTGRVARMEN